MGDFVLDKTAFEFHDSESAWRSIDDVVMGGLSSSRMWVEQGRAVFDGELSLENNGGFASVRSDPLNEVLTGASGSAWVNPGGNVPPAGQNAEGRLREVSAKQAEKGNTTAAASTLAAADALAGTATDIQIHGVAPATYNPGP